MGVFTQHCSQHQRICMQICAKICFCMCELDLIFHQGVRKCPTIPSPETMKQLPHRKIWKIPNHERDIAKRWCILQIPHWNMPSGQTVWLFRSKQNANQWPMNVKRCIYAHVSAHEHAQLLYTQTRTPHRVQMELAMRSSCKAVLARQWDSYWRDITYEAPGRRMAWYVFLHWQKSP